MTNFSTFSATSIVSTNEHMDEHPFYGIRRPFRSPSETEYCRSQPVAPPGNVRRGHALHGRESKQQIPYTAGRGKPGDWLKLLHAKRKGLSGACHDQVQYLLCSKIITTATRSYILVV